MTNELEQTAPQYGEPDGVEPIAVVGLSCRVPGARDQREFWQNLKSGTESVSFFSREEQLAAGVPEHKVDDPAFVAAAPMLDDVGYFDASFFGMTSREAQLTDPQHRLFLELAHTALEDAGYDPARYDGEIGVYGGTGADDYMWEHIKRNQRLLSGAGLLSMNVGNNPDYLATLVSYKLNLRGPSFTLHTACSTSLVATHLAAEALRNGECDMALAGGVCIELPHGHGYIHHDGGITSPDGHCRPFDAKAAGTMWGSGAGVAVLKRLPDAIADGDHIHGLILGNAINNDGSAKVGFTAPSAEGQAEVVAQALGLAAVDPRTITYVEAHGTGTGLGDPIEVSALSRAYGTDTEDTGWCGIGSVKSNIGHLSQAAGIVGVIKTLLAMKHRLIPPTINFDEPNPAIDFDTSPFYVAASLSTWEPDGVPRRAGVSSFGIGGTNAHVVLEEAPVLDRPRPAARPHLVQLSARSEAALGKAVDRLAGHLTDHPELDLADVAHTLRVGRAVHGHRVAVVASDTADAVAGLRDKKRRLAGAAPGTPPQVALMFSGQGSQYAGMGSELYAQEPVFAAAVDECASVLTAELGRDLRALLFATGSDEERAAADAELGQTALTQPALFTIEYALAKLWLSWGVSPAALVGHSIGEYVAATLAGVFTVEDAVRLVAARGRLMQSLPAGSMVAVQRGEDEISARLPEGLSIATVNGPGTCVVAGETELVEAFQQALKADGIGAKVLRTSHAFHSPMMDPILDEFRSLVAAVPRQAPRLPVVSNRTGDWLTAEQATDPSYWAGHLRHAVRFGDCVATVYGSGGEWQLLECGPGRQLAGLARMQVPKGAAPAVHSLPGPTEKQGDLATILAAVGKLWAAGVPLPSFGGTGFRVPLPTYPFERKHHWVDPDPIEATAATAVPEPTGPLPLDDWFSVPTWRQQAPTVARTAMARCLLFANDERADRLAAELRAGGTDVTVVRPGGSYQRDADTIAIRPAERADYDTLVAELAELVGAGGLPDRIVHAWALSGEPAGADLAALNQAQDLGFYSLLYLCQALAGADLTEPVRLDAITTGTVGVTGTDLTRPEHATVAGIAKVVPLELSASVSVHQIDCDATDNGLVGALLSGSDGEPADAREVLVALRNGRRWLPDAGAVALPAAPDRGGAAVRENGVYVITGGLGGIGVTIAEDLANRVQARLVLLSRSGLPARDSWDEYLLSHGETDRTGRAIAAVRRIEKAGGEVLPLAADVVSVEDLRRVRDETIARFGRVDGIVHAAGLPGGGLVEVKERADAERVFGPKLTGTLALYQAFGDLELDFVALCSSITSVIGGLGQVDYCAANSFLDAYAASDHGWRARVVSINWGGWLEVGMAVETEVPEQLRAFSRAGQGQPVEHPLLTAYHPATGDDPAWVGGRLDPERHWILDEHRIAGVPVLPGTGHLDVARAAAAAVLPAPGPDAVIELRDVAFLEPLAVPDGTGTELRVVFGVPTGEGVDFQITSGTGTTHVRGTAGWIVPAPASVRDLDAIRARCGTPHDLGPDDYASRSGLVSFGPRWRSLRRVYVGDGEELALLEAAGPVAGELDRWGIHPAVLDEATSFGTSSGGPALPLGYGRIAVRGPMPARVWAHLRHTGSGGSEIESADITLLDDAGNPVVEIGEFMLRRVDPTAMTSTVSGSDGGAGQAAGTGPAGELGIRPADGAEAFRRLLGTDLGPQVVVSVRSVAAAMASTWQVTTEAVAAQLDAEDAVGADRTLDDDWVAPRNELEATLAGIWADVLGAGRVGAEDDFFDLGGNSLVAVQLIAQIRKAVNVKLPMRSLFETPTVAGLAKLVEQLRATESTAGAAPAETSIPRLARPGR